MFKDRDGRALNNVQHNVTFRKRKAFFGTIKNWKHNYVKECFLHKYGYVICIASAHASSRDNKLSVFLMFLMNFYESLHFHQSGRTFHLGRRRHCLSDGAKWHAHFNKAMYQIFSSSTNISNKRLKFIFFRMRNKPLFFVWFPTQNYFQLCTVTTIL